MAGIKANTGFAKINGAQLYYEIAGEGQPFVMIHAGIADQRQWNNEFAHFAAQYRVLRYDQRGFGKSEPVEGEFNYLKDLTALLDALGFDQPLIVMGCSMGGGIAMDFTLTNPARVKALIMVDSGPGGLELDVPRPAQYEAVVQAFDAGDLERVNELEMQVWFDGAGRSPERVNQTMRRLAYEMNRIALSNEAKEIGKRLPNTDLLACEHLADIHVPVLIFVGAHDTPYILAAADYMLERLPSARKALIQDAAHLSNMDQPEEFRSILETFLAEILH